VDSAETVFAVISIFASKRVEPHYFMCTLLFPRVATESVVCAT